MFVRSLSQGLVYTQCTLFNLDTLTPYLHSIFVPKFEPVTQVELYTCCVHQFLSLKL